MKKSAVIHLSMIDDNHFDINLLAFEVRARLSFILTMLDSSRIACGPKHGFGKQVLDKLSLPQSIFSSRFC
jgi:hypothetical protein